MKYIYRCGSRLFDDAAACAAYIKSTLNLSYMTSNLLLDIVAGKTTGQDSKTVNWIRKHVEQLPAPYIPCCRCDRPIYTGDWIYTADKSDNMVFCSVNCLASYYLTVAKRKFKLGEALTNISDDNELIENCNLSKRTKYALLRSGYTTLGKVASLSFMDTEAIRGFGSTCLAELMNFLEDNSFDITSLYPPDEHRYLRKRQSVEIIRARLRKQ